MPRPPAPSAYARTVAPETSFPRLSGSADVSVRPARAEDAAEIARIQVVTWQHGEHTLDTGLLPRYDADRKSLLASVQNLLNLQNERSAT